MVGATRTAAPCSPRTRYGPDRSAVVGRFADGWTIRRMVTLIDEFRQGWL